MCAPSLRESVDDDERSGRSPTSKTDENVDKIKEMMTQNRKLTIGEMAANLNIAYESVQDILFNDLGLREAIRQKRPDLWESSNARSHKTIVIRNFLTKNRTNTIQEPPNSTDLTPCDYFLFSRLKKSLRGTRFSSQEEIMKKSNTALMAKPKTEYKKCFEDWIKRWHECDAVDEEYFEGHNIDFDE